MRPIDADALARRMCELCNQYYSDDPCEPSDCIFAWAVKEAPTLTPPNEWVRVEERMPEEEQIVLVHQKNGFIYCAEYFAGNKLLSPAWFIDNDCWEVGEVTHWMPLPAPPGTSLSSG